MNANQHFALRAERDTTLEKIFELMDELEVLHVLRTYTPPRQRHLPDRLETQLRLREKIENQLGDSNLNALWDDDDDAA
jgi:hypothetical protein